MHRNVTKPGKVAAANNSMTNVDLSTPMQPKLEVPSEEMNILQDGPEVSMRSETRRLVVLAVLTVVVTPVVTSKMMPVVGGMASTSTSTSTSMWLSMWLSLSLSVVLVWSFSRVLAVLSEERPFKAKLLSPPGSWAQVALSFVFPKKTFDNVYAQAIADMRDEHFEALADGRLWKARWIVLAYYINLVLTVSAWFGTSALQKVVGLWKVSL